MSAGGEGDGGRHPVHEYMHALWVKFNEDDVYFMASAIAFNLLVAAIPLVLLCIGLTAYVLSAHVHDPVEAIVTIVAGNVPQATAGFNPAAAVRAVVSAVMARRTGFTLFGALFFVWLATRLVGTLRSVLRRVFQVERTRGIVHGKIFDAQVVVVGVVLLTLNLGVTIAYETALVYGGKLFGLGGPAVSTVDFYLGNVVAVASIWALFLIVYRYLPATRTPWVIAFVAATFASLIHEALKQGFSWYATEVADYTSTWGNLATVAILLFWIYYEALGFILGGEIAQVYTNTKAPTVQSSGTTETQRPAPPEVRA